MRDDTAQKLLDLVKRLNYAWYVHGTPRAMRPIMAETKGLIQEAEQPTVYPSQVMDDWRQAGAI